MDKIIVAMSGGVDSSVAALLLKKKHRDHIVEGLFMKNWDDDDGTEQCTSARDLIAAAQVCDALGMPLHTVNFAREYKEHVFAHFLQEHRDGRTPNPDVLCNREIKFQAFAQHAQRLGAKTIATGHYARLRNHQGKLQLLSATDEHKDQSYFLYALKKQQLQNVLFPIGVLPKSEVRDKARAAGFHNHDRPDSTGICFIGERHFQSFLARYLPKTPGDIVDLDGKHIGRHIGTHYYTLGQRRGLGIGGQKNSDGSPWYVVRKELATNTLVAVQGVNHPALYHHKLRAHQTNWIDMVPDTFPIRCHAKIRYRNRAQSCIIHTQDAGRTLDVCFDQAQRAITPGQSVVFYAREVCLGGAVIDAIVN